MTREPPIGKPIRAAFFISYIGELWQRRGFQTRGQGVRLLPPVRVKFPFHN